MLDLLYLSQLGRDGRRLRPAPESSGGFRPLARTPAAETRDPR